MRKGFSLVELIVVIGILAILMGVLLASFRGGTESARAAKCLTNMKNLASACQTYGMATRHYPLAGSVEQLFLDESQGVRNVQKGYREVAGWISWNSQGAYRTTPRSHVASSGWMISAYSEDDAAREYCLTNGALWKYVSGNRGCFQCPSHVKRFERRPPAWSYVMNSYFGWDQSQGSRPKDSRFYGIGYGDLSRGDKRLLFAELPFMGVETAVDSSSGSGTRNDCVLQYKDSEGGEMIGFNHGKGKNDRCAHVAFADGHVEKIAWPKKGLSEKQVKELTRLLCEGKDVSYNGTQYEELK